MTLQLSDKIAIVGDGIAGRYLYRLLQNEGMEQVDLYGFKKDTKCGIRPCAWGVVRRFWDLASRVDLIPDDFILEEFGHVLINGIWVRAQLFTFDKARFLEALVPSSKVQEVPPLPGWTEVLTHPDWRGYRYVIDATGVARAVLGPLEGDLISRTFQLRLRSSIPITERTIVIRTGYGGYLWLFPLGGCDFHFGCGSLTENPGTILQRFGGGNYLKTLQDLFSGDNFESTQTIAGVCGCPGSVRLTGPKLSQPFVRGNVWGVGEAIGLVTPLTGMGVTPAMESARILMQEIGNSEGYTRHILRAYSWMDEERVILDGTRYGRWLTPLDYMTVVRNAERVGLSFGFFEAMRLAGTMMRRDYGT